RDHRGRWSRSAASVVGVFGRAASGSGEGPPHPYTPDGPDRSRPRPGERRLMDHRLLGRTGVSVSKMCLGAMMFGAWGNEDHDDSIRIIHAALDAGINFIDTADVYRSGEWEEIVAKALAGRRDEVVLATKFFGTMG